ncbi:helix-turn-helix transcriptional regulator [Kribbella sp.]|uniref:helix-turn-helix domain-containing protein n=1 Tax=Kribbella sp. TaxID=1871183 RepID=UPI002D64BB1A|nr:helix-turn-helix transcriptional regulator [Kribbella sp.]HZX06044.1 helix-turn-helix transcriptional regulator [Kribbella sp.]
MRSTSTATWPSRRQTCNCVRTPDRTPRTPRQQIGAELRRLRTMAGVSGRQLAQRTGLSQSRVSRIERGDALASIPELTLWLEQSRASDRLDQMVAATEAALNQTDAWHEFAQEVSFAEMQEQVRNREQAARTQLVFLSSLVPGLLQTAEYARLVFIASDLAGGQDYAAAVQRRLDRQQILYDQSHTFEFILTEAALRWRPGPRELMVAQLDRIASVATLSNVTIGVVPLDVEAHAIPWHGFTLNEDVDDGQPFVQVETMHAYLTVERPEDVDVYRRQYAVLRESALVGQQLGDFLSSVRAGLQG